MTKDQFQKELKEVVKAGIKPSQLKKLKRSKSADDIPATPNSEPTITQLQEQVKFHAQTAANYLQSLQTSQAKVIELELQLKNNPPQPTELDQSLIARHQSLKDWFQQYQKTKQLDAELQENLNEASTELITQDQTISQLQSQITQLKLTNQSLQKDLNLATKLAELRKDYPFKNEADSNYLKYGLYSLAAITLIWLLMKNH